jgi:hypothetical protein
MSSTWQRPDACNYPSQTVKAMPNVGSEWLLSHLMQLVPGMAVSPTIPYLSAALTHPSILAFGMLIGQHAS